MKLQFRSVSKGYTFKLIIQGGEIHCVITLPQNDFC